MKMLVSILVPIYNVENYIARCARSLFEQTYENIEYVFVDDCTPDKSISVLNQILEEYPQRLNAVSVFHHKQNRGLSAVRNTCIKKSNGEFVLFVDSDDYLEKNAVEKLVSKQIESQCDIITGQAIRHTQNSFFIMERPQFRKKTDFVNDMIEPTIHHTIWGRLIKRSLFIDNNIQAKEGINIGEDLQMMTQLAFFCNKDTSISDIVYHYDTTNMNSLMNTKKNAKNLYKLQQDKDSMKQVYSFFKTHDTNYVPKIVQYLKFYLNNLAKEYCAIGNKHAYTNTQKEIKELNLSITFKERLFLNNYYLCKFFLFIEHIL